MSYKGIFRKAGIDITGRTLSLQRGYKFHMGSGTSTSTPIYIDSVGNTSSVVISTIAAYLGATIRTGDYQNTADGGVILTSDNTYNAAFLADDSGANIAASVRNVLGRTLLTTSQSGGSIRSVMGQLKLLTGVNLATGVYTGVQGYIELAGDTTISSGAKASGMDISIEVASTKTLTIASGGIFAGLKIETTGAGTLANSGDCAAIYVESAGTVTDWPVGIDLNDITTGIDIGACTTGINISGAVADGILIAGACSDNAFEVTGAVTGSVLEVTTGGFGKGIHLDADGTTGIEISSNFTGVDGIILGGTFSDNAIEVSGVASGAVLEISSNSATGISFSGVMTTMLMTGLSQTVEIGQFVSVMTLSSANRDAFSVTAISPANAAYELRAGFFHAYPSTAEQATSRVIGIQGQANSALNVYSIKGVYGYANLSVAKTIAQSSAGVHADVNVDEATTVSAGHLAALWAQVRGDAVLTGSLYGIAVDLDMDVDAGIDFDVATGKTCTTGIELGVTGTGAYTTGINLSGGCATGISITNPTTKAIGVTNSTAVTGLDAVTVAETYTKVDGWHVGIRSNLTYTPAGGTGYAGIYPLYAKGVLDGTFSGGTEYFFAAKLRLDLTASAVCDNAGSFFDPLILQITANSGATMTAGMTSFLHLQWSSDKSFAGIFNSGTMNPSTWIYVDAMAKGAVVPPDSVFCIRSYLTPYLFDFNNLAMCASLSDTGGTAGADCVGHIKIRWNGADAYINVFSDNS